MSAEVVANYWQEDIVCPVCGAGVGEPCSRDAEGVHAWHTRRVTEAVAESRYQMIVLETARTKTTHQHEPWQLRESDGDGTLYCAACGASVEEWVYGAEARAAALAAGRSDWMEVTGWPLHLEKAHAAAKGFVEQARESLRAAEREELAALTALMAKDAVQKRPLEPQPAEETPDLKWSDGQWRPA